jgi:hypothetical protein
MGDNATPSIGSDSADRVTSGMRRDRSDRPNGKVYPRLPRTPHKRNPAFVDAFAFTAQSDNDVQTNNTATLLHRRLEMAYEAPGKWPAL